MKTYITLLAATLSLGAFARADEIQFTTLPQPIQTSVIRETHISGPTAVTRVMHDSGGIYAVTVRENEGTRVVYVNESGAIVQAPSSTTTTTTTTTEPTEEQVVTYEQVQQDVPRYQLIEKKGEKEIYLDRQTGKKVKVKREKD
jgi:Fe-S cluster biogenesis protein NfuA